jgi:hypothetical protein
MPFYAISAVRYDLDRSRVIRVQIHTIHDGQLGEPMELTRQQLLTTAKLGAQFVRVREDDPGRSFRPVPVQFVRLGGEVYVRCDANPWPLDDLIGIPEY